MSLKKWILAQIKNFRKMKASTASTLIMVMALCMLSIFIFTSKRQMKDLTNSQLEAMYKSVTDKTRGFSSNDYSVTNYSGNKKIFLPATKSQIFVTNTSGLDSIFFNSFFFVPDIGQEFIPGTRGQGVEISPLGTMVRICYKDKPFAQSYETISPIKFSMAERDINGDSFVFIHGDYDMQGEFAGLYVNGTLVSQRIIINGVVPFTPIDVKKIGEDVIVFFSNPDGANLYALYQAETRRIILPIGIESIENDYTTPATEVK